MHRAAWVGAVLIGLLQILVPLVLIGWALVHAFLGALTTPTPEVGSPAHVTDRVVYAVPIREEGDNVFSSAERHTLVGVALDDDDAPQPVVEIEGDAPMLLEVGEAVWAIDDEAVAIVEGTDVRRIALAEPLPSRFWPVVIDGAAAVVTIDRDYETEGFALAVRGLEGDRFAVQRAEQTTLAFDPRQLRAVAMRDGLHVLVDGYDAPVHHAVWRDDGLTPWTRTDMDLSEWTAVAFAGAPAVFGLDDSAETTAIVGWRPSTGWRKFMTEPDAHAFRIGAVAIDDARVAVVTDTSFDGVAVTEIAPDGIVARHEHSSSRVMEETIGLIVLSQVAPLLFTVLLALVLAGRMRIHCVGEHVAGTRVARYASLTRRALAKAIDAAIAAAVPLAVLVPGVLDGQPLDESALIGVCLLWGVPLGIAFTVLEGVYGQTPGKRLLRIRVVGLDLRTAGIGPAFVRALVGIVDGLFEFIVGIVAVATNRQWQRIGDQVAHTIVIDDAIVERESR